MKKRSSLPCGAIPFLLHFLFLAIVTHATQQTRCTIEVVTYTNLKSTLTEKLPYYHSREYKCRPVIFRSKTDEAVVTQETIDVYSTLLSAETSDVRIGSSTYWASRASSTLRASLAGVAPDGTTVDELLTVAFSSEHDVTATLTATTLPPLLAQTFRHMHNLANESAGAVPASNRSEEQRQQTYEQDQEQDQEQEQQWLQTTSQHIFASNANSGVHFHRSTASFTYHAAGNQVQWFLFPPHTLLPLEHTPRTSISDWYRARIYPLLEESELPIECATQPGDLLYIPEGWWQAYVVDDNVATKYLTTTTSSTTTSSSSSYLARSQWKDMTTSTELLRQKAQRAKQRRDYTTALEWIEELLFHTERQDLEALYQMGIILGRKKSGDVEDLRKELSVKKEVMLAMNNRSCDVLHSFGRTMLRTKNYIQARALSRKCVTVCDRFSKCYELLSRAVEGVRGQPTSVSKQALEMSREYKKEHPKTIEFASGKTLQFP